MADLIERDALLLKQKAHADLFADSTVHDDIVRRDEATAALAEIINAPTVNRWISVHDVLPMEGMDVLVCNFDEWCGIASYHGDYWEDDEGRCVPAYAISHWQELPALPKREV